MSWLNWDGCDYDRGPEGDRPDTWRAPKEPLTVEQVPTLAWRAFRDPEGIYGYGETREEAIQNYYDEGGK